MMSTGSFFFFLLLFLSLLPVNDAHVVEGFLGLDPPILATYKSLHELSFLGRFENVPS